MASYNVECFSNTGFNPVNIPDSYSRLRALVTPISYPAIWTLQDRDLSNVRIAVAYESIKNVDYACIGNTYYFVTKVNMLNENTAELSLQTDFLTTIGISNLGVVSGWCTRRSVTSDVIFNNEIDENFVPTQELVLDIGVKLGDDYMGGEFLDVACCTVNLSALNFDADTYTNPTEQLKVTVPKIPPVKIESELYMQTTTGSTDTGRHFKMPQTGLFNLASDEIKTKIQSIRSLGIENALTATYKIPMYFVDSTFENDGWIVQIKSRFIDNIDVPLPYEYMSGIKNKKAFSGQFQKYRVYSVTSGDSEEYRPEEIQGATSESNPKFIIFADPQPTGKPYCRPKYYRSDATNIFIECVEGSQWQNYQITFTAQSGQALADLQQNRKRFEQSISAVQGIADVAIGAYTGNVAQAGKGALDLANTARNVQMSEQDYGIAKNVVVPDIRFPLSGNLQNYYTNCFWCMRVRLSNDDTLRFDNYLTQFGYSVYEPLTQSCFTGRKYFNYVKAESINIKNNFSLSMRLGAISQLSNGVRVWHVLPDIQYMYDNPIG